MKVLFLFFLLLLKNISMSNNPTIVYLFPGLGSDERLFEKIKLDSNFQILHVKYPTPKRGATMQEFAHEISKQIDTTHKYIFIGVSLGGMICCELEDYMKPEKTIIISSAKCRSELPFRYRFQKTIPLNKTIPKRMIKGGVQLLQPIVEPDRNKNKSVFKSMLKNKSPKYYKRTVNMIINWDRIKSNPSIISIHGTNDHTLPIKNINVNYKIDMGSHMMALTRGEETNGLLLEILSIKK